MQHCMEPQSQEHVVFWNSEFFLVLRKYCFKIHSMYFPLHHNFQEKLFRPVKKFMTKTTGAFVGSPPKSKTKERPLQ
uniref:Uncharacterized protein n=1 Tax=Populus trichocarpa TaxID=3694 RepID=U5FWP8_POPTR